MRSLILIYAEAAVHGSPGERGSCSEHKCVRTLNHVINLKSPEVNPKWSHVDIAGLVDHRHPSAVPPSFPAKVPAGVSWPRWGSARSPLSRPGRCPVRRPGGHIPPLRSEHLICCLDRRAWSQTETLTFPLIGISVLLHSLNWPLLLINEDPKVHVLKTLLS